MHGGGSVIAVLGNGLPGIYPAENRALAKRICSGAGALVSEFPLSTPPRRYHFPRRNRLISGWSDGVVVVEAALKSGSLITAGWALSQGREVCAVPGAVDSVTSAGCHQLIRDGATLVTSATEICLALYGSEVATLDEAWLGSVRSAIADGAVSPNDVMARTGLPPSLALQGWVALNSPDS